MELGGVYGAVAAEIAGPTYPQGGRYPGTYMQLIAVRLWDMAPQGTDLWL